MINDSSRHSQKQHNLDVMGGLTITLLQIYC